MSDTATPSPPPIIEPWRAVLMAVVVGAIVWWAHVIAAA